MGCRLRARLRTRVAGRCSSGSVYAALARLEAKGLVTSGLADPTPERGGRAKKYFRATARGLRVARDTRRALVGLWRGIPNLEGGSA